VARIPAPASTSHRQPRAPATISPATISVPGGANARNASGTASAIRLSRFTKKGVPPSRRSREWTLMMRTLRARLGRAALLVVILPAAVLAAAIREYAVDVPYKDQWEIAHFFVEYERGTLSLGDLFAQVNEYRQFFPNLLFLGLGELTHWRVHFELAVSFLLACLAFVNISLLAGRTLAASGALRLATTFLAAVLIFSPVQHENWLWGIQLVYFVPIACVTTGIVVAYSGLGTIPKFVLGGSLAAVSTFSSANGILAWVVLLPVLLLLLRASTRIRARFAAAWTVLLVASTALYFYGYESPPGHPALTEALVHPFHALVYVVGFLGSPLAVRAGPDAVAGATAGVAGGLVLAAFVASCVYIWRFRRDRALVERASGWIALGAYSIATGILVSVGRVGFGVGQSLASRYTTFSLYLAVALIFLAAIVVQDLRRRDAAPSRRALVTRFALGAAASLVALQLFVVVSGFRAMEDMNAQLRQGKECLRLINIAPDRACLVENVYPDVDVLRARANQLDEIGFLRPPLATPRRPRG
jgi:hypothetical protein